MCSSEGVVTEGPAPSRADPVQALPVKATPGREARDRGYATAETAVVLPVLALFTAMLLWGVMAAAAQIQCVDAARAGARAAARSEPEAQVREVALSAAPRGAQIALVRAGDLVRVRVTARSLGPGPLAGALSAELGAEAAALSEDRVGGAVP